ncbi:DoxX family protein [Leptospira gomenensis]|uniref:DoxX family protein n=1 Tax=Leptospira gomenensis TaxID=2484974 RepID=A0A5F1Y8E4_9LEPT|nr:DoxX family protein [Leptospira gomenensis]TGK29434.1 DoxX family protein [Leptospira gomenensis]TGK33663.1 DoxX family protein [Leptospira gomenensis]TGK44904.1 DoxX family protein [Leptospira gomenensis]TGK64525.1 DoxX family protein [Leptospira gomenensis]
MKQKILGTQPLNVDIASLLLRLIFGCMFVYHGSPKLFGFEQISAVFPDLIGIGAKTSLALVVFAEFFCGIAVAIGLLSRLTVIPIFITMSVAFFIAHANDPFQVKTLPFVYLLLSSVIFFLGSGRYSVDNLLFKK